MEVSGENVENFKEFCGITDEDVAVRYLRHCHGDLQAAVQLYFQTDGILDDDDNEDADDMDVAEYPRNGRARALDHDWDHAETSSSLNSIATARPGPQWSVVQPWRQFIVALITLPFNFVFTTIFDILKFFCDIIFGERRPSITNYREDVAKFRQGVRERLGERQVEFYDGTYEEQHR
ncbi:unnamed protein product [Cylicostephanus goldi]|uniref:UBX domain-containing protein n=1 Tax=Cylicostephanus goldi TaxID=71465 RepID=A0A3P6UN85_CYLGO|nr:unnamed protein product [Cylicostephanus goldi]